MSADSASKMKYVNLGKSGLKVGTTNRSDRADSLVPHLYVSQIVLGCMSYGVKRPKDNWTWVLEEEEAMKHLKASAPVLAFCFQY